MSSAKQSVKRALALSTGAVLSAGALCMVPQAANAATGDEITVGSVTTARNGAGLGAVVVLKTKNITAADVDPTNGAFVANSGLTVSNTALNGSPNDASQTVGAPQFVSFVSDASQATQDGFDEITVRIPVTTPAVGSTANFAIYLDDDVAGGNNDTVQATEPRAQVAVTTSGAPSTVAISPASQTAAANTASAPYTVTITDAGGRQAQLVGGETLTTAGTSGTVTVNGTFDATTLADGTQTFTATGTAAGAQTIKLNYSGDVTKNGTATLNVSPNATITADELDIVSGADTWNGFGGGTLGVNTTAVRIDQGTVTLDFQSKDGADVDTIPDDANSVVTVTAAPGGGATFGGTNATKTYTITLDAAGKGSIAITPDAGSIVDGSFVTLSINGAQAQTLAYQRAAAEAIGATATTDASVYLTKIGSPTSVTVTVKDQFGNVAPAGTQVALVRSGRAANAGTTARATVDATGKATFSLADAGTAAGSEFLQVVVYTDQFDASGTNRGTARIDFTTDGLGTDFGLTVDDDNSAVTNPLAAGYAAADYTVIPLTDTAVTAGAQEGITVGISGATNGAPAVVSVDNGALILADGDNTLAKATASKTITLAGGVGSFTVIGTKTGTVNVTVASGGRTKTFAVTVEAGSVARNLDVTGPTKVTAGSNQNYTVLVTDAFGNPVVNQFVTLSIQYAGPVTQNGSVSNFTDAAGKIVIPVRVNTGATDPVKVTVTGSFDQFGAAADRQFAGSTTNDGVGLTASVATDTVTTEVVDIAALQAAVDAAQAKVDAATTQVSNATDAVTLATLKVDIAQGKVADAKKDVQKAKKALAKAKKSGKGVKAAKAKLAKAKRALKNAQNNLKVAKAGLTIANNKLTAAQATLAAAQQELADAQAALAAAQQS